MSRCFAVSPVAVGDVVVSLLPQLAAADSTETSSTSAWNLAWDIYGWAMVTSNVSGPFRLPTS